MTDTSPDDEYLMSPTRFWWLFACRVLASISLVGALACVVVETWKWALA